ncbi:MAG: response regulator [Candidatus Heimdallarchaeota archaeon]
MSEILNVLFIEDSEDDALLMIHCLNGLSADFQHQRVESKEELIAVIKEDKWDLIITDNALPQLSGSEAIELIRKRGIETPIICVSGTDIGEYSQECINAGAVAFVLKDDFEKLREIVEKIINELSKS